MNQTTRHLDEESQKALALLAKSKIQALMSKSSEVQFGSAILEVLSISIQLDDRCFAVIESDWGDTPKEWLDFHHLSVRITNNPRNIQYNPKPPKNGAHYQSDHMCLSLGAEESIATIEVLEDSEVGKTESVAYDAGLLITRRDGLRLAIVRTKSIVGSLQIAHTPTDIQALTDGLTVRLRFGA